MPKSDAKVLASSVMEAAQDKPAPKPLSVKEKLAKITVAFAADLEPEYHNFEMHGLECYFATKPMDGSAKARYKSTLIGSGVSIQRPTRDSDEEPQAEVEQRIDFDFDKAELDLLVASVVDYALPKKGKTPEGEDNYSLTKSEGKNSARRKEDFQGLAAELRAIMVEEAARVNGLDFLL